MLDPWSLRILVAVAEHGSFSAAADALVLTQPAVSRQIGGLEKQLGVPLFRRAARGVTPTPAGSTAVELARSVLGRLDAMEATMRTFAGLDAGHLRLAAFASANTYLVPEAIRRFHAEHPAVTITLQHVDPFHVLEAVRQDQVDLALLTEWQLFVDPVEARTHRHAERLPFNETGGVDGVDLAVLLDEELHLALPADHPLAAETTVPLAALREETWIEGAHPDCLGPLVALTDALGVPPRIGFTCHDWNGKQALVAAGAGIMVVPTLAREAIRSGIELRPTSPPLPFRRLHAAVARPPFRSPAADAMLALLTDLAAEIQDREPSPRPGPVAVTSRGREPQEVD